MKNDVNKKLEALLYELNKNNTGEVIEKLIKSSDGKKLAESISDADKQKLAEKFMSMSNGEIKSKLQKADLSGLGKMSSEDIMKKLR